MHSTPTFKQPHGLETSPMYTPLGTQRQGFEEIRLPSGHTALNVTAYVDVKTVLTDTSFHRAQTNREGGESWLPTTMPPEMLLNLDLPDHRRMKQFVAGPYSRQGVKRVGAACHQVLDEHLGKITLAGVRQGDLMAQVLSPVTVGTNFAFLGLPPSDLDAIRPLAREMQMASAADVPHLVESFWTLYRYLEDLVEGRRPLQDGLLRAMIDNAAHVDPPLETSELVATFLGSLVGGDQNVLTTLGKLVYICLAERDLWDHLAVDPEARVPGAVEELLRLCPLGQVSTFPRIATQPLKLSGGQIHPGDVVYANTHLANRDEDVFPDPLAIDLERQGPPHLQFGYGLHHCMGSNMARLELTTILRVLLERFPDMRLGVDASEIPWETGVLVHRPSSLPVTW
ncbi:MAG: cytochrome P450 [Nocardioides sp.]|uniref:cytochrome P450 n=1 Tax=Nocardioides sp. TaxID=35761 RepID=UPI003D6AB11D